MRNTNRWKTLARLLLTATIALASIAEASAQFDRAKGQKTNQASKRDNGSAAVLTGSVVLYNLFLSDEASSWPDKEKAKAQRKMKAAARFLRKRADRHGIELDVALATAEDVAYDRDIPTDLFADPTWTERAIKKSAGGGANELVARLKQRHKADHVLLVLHVNKPGLSYNLSYYDDVDSTYTAERLVCFTRYPDRRRSVAATYAHEILHGFGAGELYFPFDVNGDRKELAERLFPDDVMFRVDPKLGKLEIGPYTAYRIGWQDDLPQQYRVFED